MLEDIGGLRNQALLVDNLQCLQLAQQSLELAAKASYSFQQTSQELAADYGGKLHCTLALLAEAVEPRHDYPLDSVRDSQFAQGLGHSVVAILTGNETQIEQRLGDFFNEERHPFRLLHQRGFEFIR